MQPPQQQHTCYVGSCTSHRTVLAPAALLEAFHSLPELPVLSWPHCLFLTSSPLPGENFQQSPTQTGPPSRPLPLTPSHQPSPETVDGAENMASGTAAGDLAAGRGVYIDLSPGTPGEGWPAGSGCPGQLILAPQGLIIAENGPCCAGQAQGTGVGP